MAEKGADMSRVKILCVDDDPDFVLGLKIRLSQDYEFYSADNVADAILTAKRVGVNVTLLDITLGREDGICGIKHFVGSGISSDVIMISGRRDSKSVVESMRAGASDYLTKPIDIDELKEVIDRLVDRRKIVERYEALLEEQNSKSSNVRIVFQSPAIGRVISQAEQLKGHRANVLIVGESGTGKELIARYIHRLENDATRPFVAVNCAAIPENLVESELFGAEAGAFTGSIKRRIGKFELADGGDIFLDEVGALRPDMQAKILRVLQEREFQRLGGNETIKADFRVIAATNDSLEDRVGSGLFRMDLYHRIRVIQIDVPPLRSRTEDIPLLVDYYLSKFAKNGIRKRMGDAAMARLISYNWPGNVRELANVVHSLAILSPTEIIHETAFPAWALNGCGARDPKEVRAIIPYADELGALRDFVAKAERHYIDFALRRCRGDKSKTARMLQVGRTTLYAKMKELGIARDLWFEAKG